MINLQFNLISFLFLLFLFFSVSILAPSAFLSLCLVNFFFFFLSEKFGNRDYLLTIEYATMDDDAEYSVLAKNIGGESRAMAQLLVEPLESMESG